MFRRLGTVFHDEVVTNVSFNFLSYAVFFCASLGACVWADVDISSRDFIRDYLDKYPVRAMVSLKAGQVVTTEWNTEWSVTKLHDIVLHAFLQLHHPLVNLVNCLRFKDQKNLLALKCYQSVNRKD